MKNKLLVSLLLTSIYSFSQFHLGIKGGINISKVNPYTNRTSLHLGMTSNLILAEMIVFQPEILYTQLGGKSYDYSYTRTFANNYLCFPLMTKFFLTEKLAFEIGPQPSVLLSSKYKTSFGLKEPAKVKANAFDFALVFGLSHQFTQTIMLETRLGLGLNNVYKSETGFGPKNKFFQISLGYIFNNKKPYNETEDLEGEETTEIY